MRGLAPLVFLTIHHIRVRRCGPDDADAAGLQVDDGGDEGLGPLNLDNCMNVSI